MATTLATMLCHDGQNALHSELHTMDLTDFGFGQVFYYVTVAAAVADAIFNTGIFYS